MATSQAQLIQKIERALGRELLEFKSGIQRGLRSERVIGFVVSKEFTGQDHVSRQNRLQSILRQALTPDELLHIGPIATLSPEEANVTRRAG